MEDDMTPIMCPDCMDDGVESPLYLPSSMLTELRLTIKMEFRGMCLICGTCFPCFFNVSDDTEEFEGYYDYAQ